MTFPRYRSIIERVMERPTTEFLLTWIAAAYGYKPQAPAKTEKISGEKYMSFESVQELMGTFPGGTIKIG